MNARESVLPDPEPARFDFTSPLTIPGGGVTGAEVVRELPPEVALTAWQVLRSLLLWTGEAGEGRAGLFEPGAMEAWELQLLAEEFDPGLRLPLAVVVGELARGAAAAPERVAWGCLCVAEWALANGATATALVFAEAAALSWPEHPRYAWTVGRLLRVHGRPREAEMWLRRAVRLAIRAGDGEAQVRALIALGNLSIELGNFPEAKNLHTQAVRLARRSRLREPEAMALHELFVVTTETNDSRKADEYAWKAFEAYGAQHPRIPSLAHDVAYYWMNNGYFSRALPIFTALRESFDAPELQFRVIANAARAAGALGERSVFECLWAEAQARQDQLENQSTLACALVELALGALNLREWDRAAEALKRAIVVAQARGEANVVHRAESLREAVRSQRFAEAWCMRAASTKSVTPADLLARSLVHSLQTTQWVAEVATSP